MSYIDKILKNVLHKLKCAYQKIKVHIYEKSTKTVCEERLLFASQNDVYLASADRMSKVLYNISILRTRYAQGASTYASVIGGLSGLNYIAPLRPDRIIFFDTNSFMVNYCALILKLIAIANSPEDFISRIFSRDVSAFTAANGNRLCVENQHLFLACTPEEAIYQDTVRALSPDEKATYDDYIRPHHLGDILQGVRNCRQLLPCWPENSRVPVGAGDAFGGDEHGNLVPNVNTFFYGSGWLGSQDIFLQTKRILESSNTTLLTKNILQENINGFFDAGCALALHISNIDDWFPEATQEIITSWHTSAHSYQSDFLVITSHNGIYREYKNPHCIAYEAVKRRIRGKVVEITTKPDWGFHEFERINIIAEEYIKNDIQSDTVIFHILVGEGKQISFFTELLIKSMQLCTHIIILEHNRKSKDWIDTDITMFSPRELIDILSPLTHKYGFSTSEMLMLPGEKDHLRNILLVLNKDHNSFNLINTY